MNLSNALLTIPQVGFDIQRRKEAGISSLVGRLKQRHSLVDLHIETQALMHFSGKN